MMAATDIERTYGQRKLLAQRTPVYPNSSRKAPEQTEPSPAKRRSREASVSSVISTDLSTPAATEGETASETDEVETETETELEIDVSRRRRRRSGPSPKSSNLSTKRARSPVLSMHDLNNTYFRKDAVLLRNIDLLRYVIHISVYAALSAHCRVGPVTFNWR